MSNVVHKNLVSCFQSALFPKCKHWSKGKSLWIDQQRVYFCGCSVAVSAVVVRMGGNKNSPLTSTWFFAHFPGSINPGWRATEIEIILPLNKTALGGDQSGLTIGMLTWCAGGECWHREGSWSSTHGYRWIRRVSGCQHTLRTYIRATWSHSTHSDVIYCSPSVAPAPFSWCETPRSEYGGVACAACAKEHLWDSLAGRPFRALFINVHKFENPTASTAFVATL